MDVDEVRTMRRELSGEIATVRREFEMLRTEIRDDFAEDRRHMEALFEILRGDIRSLTECVAAVIVKLDSLQR